ncbi:MAG: NAD(P)H-binding protein, partial [Bacteroidota bacterium]
MKICLLGATGRSGRALLTQALEAGHDVRAVARKPNRLA